MRARGLASIAATLLAMCAAVPLASDDRRAAEEPAAVAALRSVWAGTGYRTPFSIPAEKQFARYLGVDGRAAYRRIRVVRSLFFDREGRIYVDFNTIVSFGVKPDMGSLKHWAESHSAGDLLCGLSLYLYVRY